MGDVECRGEKDLLGLEGLEGGRFMLGDGEMWVCEGVCVACSSKLFAKTRALTKC